MFTLEEMIAHEDAREGIKTTKREIEAIRTTIEVLVIGNPKKPGTMSYTRFDGYLSEKPETIQEAFDAGLRGDDIRHDVQHGFIRLV